MNDNIVTLPVLSEFKTQLINWIDGPALDMAVTYVLNQWSESDEISNAIGGVDGFNTLFEGIKQTGRMHLINSYDNNRPGPTVYNLAIIEDTENNIKNISWKTIEEGSMDAVTGYQITYMGADNSFHGYQSFYYKPGVFCNYGYKFNEDAYEILNSSLYLEHNNEWGIVCNTEYSEGIPSELRNTGPLVATLKTMRPYTGYVGDTNITKIRQDLYVPDKPKKNHFYRTVTNVIEGQEPNFGPWQNISEDMILELVEERTIE